MDSDKPCARLCHIVKWDDFDGYGFNLHAEKGKTGQYIGKVDEGSPSEAAGLKQGDRIVEVNEINIANETHKQVVERIKAFPTETKLLVVDEQADEYFKANNVPIKGSMPGVKYLKTPERSPGQDEGDEDEETDKPSNGNGNILNTGKQGTSDTHSIASSSDGHSHKENGNGSTATRLKDDDNLSTKSSTSKDSSSQQPSNGTSLGALNLTMSAKELRAKLAARKKYDPKKETIGFKDKFDIVQKL